MQMNLNTRQQATSPTGLFTATSYSIQDKDFDFTEWTIFHGNSLVAYLTGDGLLPTGMLMPQDSLLELSYFILQLNAVDLKDRLTAIENLGGDVPAPLRDRIISAVTATDYLLTSILKLLK
jgi:hypothetical protein